MSKNKESNLTCSDLEVEVDSQDEIMGPCPGECCIRILFLNIFALMV